jgi:hypothetical protein
MTRIPTHLAVAALLLGAAALPALAESSIASSASDSVSASSDSASGSLRRSSNSSSDTKQIANGDYKIIDVAAVAERPGTLRLTLQALATPGIEGEVMLYVPQVTVAQAQLATGITVHAQQRPYGVEFAAAQTPFFLVLSDAWMKDLPSQPVVL